MSSSVDMASIISICTQRRKLALNPLPPVRIDILDSSPYTTTSFTKFDLDMRRKAEILKYKSPTQLGSNTKSSQWSQMANGPSITIPSAAILRQTEQAIIISNCRPIPASVSSCDVPLGGNTNILYDDETVLLYNYINPILTRSYGFQDLPLTTDPFSLIQSANVFCASSQTTFVGSIIFREAIANTTTTFTSIQIPIALQLKTPSFVNNSSTSISLDIQLIIMYNGSIITPYSTYAYTFESGSNSSNLVFASGNPPSFTLNLLQYMGLLTISNVVLPSEPNFIYDFYLLVNPTIVSSQLVITTLVANVTTNLLLPSTYCALNPMVSTNNVPLMTATI